MDDEACAGAAAQAAIDKLLAEPGAERLAFSAYVLFGDRLAA